MALHMANEHTEFWLALLELGDTEHARRRLWNAYCLLKCLRSISRFLDIEEQQKAKSRLGFSDPYQLNPFRDAIDKFVNERESVPIDSPDLFGDSSAFMDFSDIEFDDDVSFAGRLMIGANFSGAEFRRTAAFEGVEFIGPASFAGTKFFTDEVPMSEAVNREVSFSKATFHGSAAFSGAQFPEQSDFREALFRRGASFGGAEFVARFVRGDLNYAFVSFKLSKFDGTADFRDAVFGADAAFDNSTMKEGADFTNAAFSGTVRFQNCRFRSTTSFRNAVFRTPPELFETELHEDVDFGGIDWKLAETNYHRSTRRDELTSEKSIHADHAMRAWERLALIMSQREKREDRHQFFRLKMRAERWRDGIGFLSSLNWLFDKFSDYGWSAGRAFGWWAGHVLLVGAILAGVAMHCSLCAVDGGQRFLGLFRDGVLLSFANSHSFLGLASNGGWLEGSKDAIVDSCCETAAFAAVFGYIGLVQAVLGPILLFLILLTLRNRFRLT